MLSESGVEIEGYVPYNSYILSIPKTFERTKLSNLGGIDVVSFSAENKSSGPITLGIAENQWQFSSILDLQVECYVSVNKSEIEKNLRQFGIPARHGTHERTYSIKVKYKDLKTLVELPFVKYVELSPGVPVPDDTKGRSLHRSNAINTDSTAA